jgi:CAAX protease family protein
MPSSLISNPRQILSLRWQPSKDLVAVALSWLLVVASLYTASIIVGPNAWGGFAYFLLYGLLTATVFGLGVPLYWTTVVRHRPIGDLGITRQHLGKSFALQVILCAVMYAGALGSLSLPPVEGLVPLVALALAIGFFEAVFWRGWVLLRLEESFGFLPAVILGSLLYSLYHVGYGMPPSEMAFLFLVGVLFAVTFRLTNSVFVLWPLFQPIGQLMTLLRDGLSLPLLAAVGFGEVFIVMVVVVWFAGRTYRRRTPKTPAVPSVA